MNHHAIEPITTYTVGVSMAISKKLAAQRAQWTVEEDPAIRSLLLHAFVDYARQIIHRQVDNAYQVYPSWWQMFKASLPRWTFRFLGQPKYEDVVAVTEYHWICPHVNVPPTELAIHFPYTDGASTTPLVEDISP